MDKKSIKLLTIANFCYFNNIYCKCSNSGKNTTKNNQGNGDSQDTEQNPNDPDKDKGKKKPEPGKENPEEKKTNKEKYIEKTKELRNKFSEYEKIINGKNIDNISETVSNHLCGFKNYGCTCYFNAAMQNLTHNKDLVKAILDYVSKAADKGTIDIEIIAFYYLIVKIYEQEGSRTKDTPVIEEELGNLRYCIALKGVDIDKVDNNRIDNFLSASQQSDSAELLTSIIADIRSIIDEENKEKGKEETYKKNIIQNILCHEYFNGRVCTNNTCSDKGNNTKTFYPIFVLPIKNEPKGCENQLKVNLENSLKVTEDSELCKCDKCSVKKIEDYKKNNLKENQQKIFKDCEHCKDYFNEIENYKKNNTFSDKYKNFIKIEEKDGNIVAYRFYNNKKQQIAAFKTHNDSELFFNQMCNECKKSFNDFWKNHIVEKKEVIKIKSTGEYFIVQNKRFEFDYETIKNKKIENDINIEENLKLEPNKHGVEREENLDLIGVICHNGTANGGHYFSYNKIGNKWYEFNDKKVSEVPNNKILDVTDIKSQNYVLFYKKQ